MFVMAHVARKVFCDCRICDGKGEMLVSLRTNRRHCDRFGKSEPKKLKRCNGSTYAGSDGMTSTGGGGVNPTSATTTTSARECGDAPSDCDSDTDSDTSDDSSASCSTTLSGNRQIGPLPDILLSRESCFLQEENGYGTDDAGLELPEIVDEDKASGTMDSSSLSINNLNSDLGIQPTNLSETSDSDSDSCSMSDNDISSDEDCLSDSEWSFVYDKEIYKKGIAIQPFNEDFSVLQALALNFDLLTSHPSMSKNAFEKTLMLQKILNPTLASWPSTYKEAKKMVNPYLCPKKIFDVCKNDCVMYRDSGKAQLRNVNTCPTCNASRYESGSVASKKFVYIPLGPRLARIYGEESLAKIVQCHSVCGDAQIPESNIMWDIHDSPVWKESYSENGYFEGDKLGLSFAFEMDGVNPFHDIKVQYSMTPMQLTLLNFPRHLRNSFSNIFLLGIIPGGKSEAKSVQIYVELLVDELIYLTGCKAYDTYSKAPVNVKIKLLLYILDYPGLCKLFLMHGSGSYMGCHWCHLKGMYCKHLNKMIYLNNRSYLPKDHPLRKDTRNYISKREDLSSPPVKRTAITEIADRTKYVQSKSNAEASRIAKNTGCKGNYAFLSLPGHNRIDETNPDGMHTIKDVLHTLTYLIIGKSSNQSKALSAEKYYDRFTNEETGGQIDEGGGVVNAQQKRAGCPCILSKNELKLADERSAKISFPTGSGMKSGNIFSSISSLKSHGWLQLVVLGVLKFCFRGLLGEIQRKSFFRFLDCLRCLCSENHNLTQLDQLEEELHICLALMERDFPIAIHNITTHILHHVVDSLRKFGPLYGTWMFVFERFNSWLCQRALNKRYPEATIVETYILYDWCQFLFATGKIPCIDSSSFPFLLGVEDITNNVSQQPCVKDSTIPVDLRAEEIKQLVIAYNRDPEVQCYVNSVGKRASLYHRYTTEHPKTKRVITYSSKQKQRAGSKVNSFIVSCNIHADETPVFGYIHCFLEHEHMTLKNSFAKVILYENILFDSESGIWCANAISSTKKFKFVHVKDLSTPLVTAIDDGQVWFLNYIK